MQGRVSRLFISNFSFMKKFLFFCLLFISPFLLLIGPYVYYDPFKVVRKYENYYIVGDGGSVNRNYVSTMNYMNKKDSLHYDSFIFGNSRSLIFFVSEWKKYISPQSVCYHFSESGGSINGLYYKIKLIDNCNEKIKNALLVVDPSLLGCLEQDGAIFIMPPILTGYKNFPKFHFEHFCQWIDLRFLVLWYQYHMTGIYKSYMNDFLVKGTDYQYYNPVTNEEPRISDDKLIQTNDYYTINRLQLFKNKQTPFVSTPVLDVEKRKKLIEIKSVFNRHHTNCKIIISPCYNQIKLNPKDSTALCEIFGAQNVFDFSGVNKWTSDYHNYYEPNHYLPSVASELMKIAYSNE